MIIFIIFLFVMLVVLHEYGHFLVARRNGVEVEEFGIGFPPKIAGREMGKGIFKGYYTINLVPIGGFVRLKGESDSDKRKGSFGAASFWIKTKITMAGVLTNLVTAWLIFTILAFVGIPKLIDNQFSVASNANQLRNELRVVFVDDGSPAEMAGIQLNDQLLSIDGIPLTSDETLFDLTERFAGQQVTIKKQTDSTVSEVTAILNAEDEGGGFFGVSAAEVEVNRYTYAAPLVGLATTAQLGWETLKGLGGLVSDLVGGEFSEAAESVSGPVGIVVILQNAADFGIEFVVFLIGLISLTLAIMNALPVPALDGGRLAVSGLFRALKRPLTPEVEQAIHGSGMVLLLLLFALITWVDVDRFL